MSVRIKFRRGGGNFTPDTALDLAEPYYNPTTKVIGIGDGSLDPPRVLMEKAGQTIQNKVIDDTNKILVLNEVGMVALWPNNLTLPPQYLECAGAAISRTDYPDYFARVGTTYGAGNGSSTFNLPSLSFASTNFRYIVRVFP